MESHHKLFLEVFGHCPRHPKLGLSPASISPTRAFAWKPPHGALYYLTPGAPTNCCFPQLAYKKKKDWGEKKNPTAFVSDNCVGGGGGEMAGRGRE